MLLDFMSVHNFVETHHFSLLFEVTLDLVSFYILPIQNNTLISRGDCNSPFFYDSKLYILILQKFYMTKHAASADFQPNVKNLGSATDQ